MGEGKLTQRQRQAYSYAAIATAIYISKMIPIGPIDLADYDYRSEKLIEFRAVLNLDQGRRVAGAAAIALNWSTLAQTKIGAPESDFVDESLVRLHGVDDEIGLHAMNKNWPVIEALAKALLQKRQAHRGRGRRDNRRQCGDGLASLRPTRHYRFCRRWAKILLA